MKIGILGSKGTTLDSIHGLRQRGVVPIDVVLSLPRELAERNDVAFFSGTELEQYCLTNGIRFRHVSSYTLKGEADLALFREEAIDLLLVIGWERLLPPAILDCLGTCACGMHGSAFGLPRGRGRSPLNWALITGKRKFLTSLFRYNSGVDAGDVIGTVAFDVNKFDSIETLHAKNRIAMMELIERHYPLLRDGVASFVPQPPGRATYYPRRTEEDGAIDWRQPVHAVYDLIRAVAPPYPGAFCFYRGTKPRIDAAQPFDTGLFDRQQEPGLVLDVSISRSRFVVATGDGTLLVTRFSGVLATELRVGDVLEGTYAKKGLATITARYAPDIPLENQEIRLD